LAGVPPSISVDSGPDRVTARGTSGVSAGGLPARFAAPARFAGLTAPACIRCGLWAAVPTAFS